LKVFSISLNFMDDLFPPMNFFFILFFIQLLKFNFYFQFKVSLSFLTNLILFCLWDLIKYLRIIQVFAIYLMVFSKIKVQSILGLHLVSFLNFLFTKIFHLLISFYLHFNKLIFSFFMISCVLDLNYHY